MESPLLISLSKADVLSRQMELVANNIANSTTTGFKQQHMLFDTQLVKPERNETLNFVVDRATYRDMSAGPTVQTGNPMDVALNGPGFLAVKDSTGQTVYSRAGTLKLSATGDVVDTLGNPVLDQGGSTINIPDTVSNITIGADGTISGEQGPIGRLQVSEFSAPQMLTPIANGYFKAADGNGNTIAPTPAAQTSVIQGAIENSNVQPVVEMTQMMDITRQYQIVQNIISGEHDRIRNAIKTLGKVA